MGIGHLTHSEACLVEPSRLSPAERLGLLSCFMGFFGRKVRGEFSGFGLMRRARFHGLKRGLEAEHASTREV